MLLNAPKDGPLLREYLKMEVPKGYNPTEPTGIQHRAPVASTVAAPGIHSGQAITLNATGEWVLADATTAAVTSMVYFPISDSYDADVRDAGTLPGLSCLGKYELMTAFFDTGTNYAVGTELTVSATNPGNVAVATTGDLVIGRVTIIGGGPDGSIVGTNGQSPADAQAAGNNRVRFVTVDPYLAA